MKSLVTLLLLLCLPLFKGHDFVPAGSHEQLFIKQENPYAPQPGNLHIAAPQRAAYVQDYLAEDDEADADEVKWQVKGHSSFKSIPGQDRSRWIDFTGGINSNRFRQHNFLLPRCEKYIFAWALRV
jgi:hypothetical protein